MDGGCVIIGTWPQTNVAQVHVPLDFDGASSCLTIYLKSLTCSKKVPISQPQFHSSQISMSTEFPHHGDVAQSPASPERNEVNTSLATRL